MIARSKPERTPGLQGDPSWERTIKAAKGKRWADQFDWELDKGNTRLFVAASNLLDRIEELERAYDLAYAEGFRRGVEAAADLAAKHDAAAVRRLKHGPKLTHLSRDAQHEILAEERGENIAAEIIARGIRALRPEGEK